jgi:hypothetical protein
VINIRIDLIKVGMLTRFIWFSEKEALRMFAHTALPVFKGVPLCFLRSRNWVCEYYLNFVLQTDCNLWLLCSLTHTYISRLKYIPGIQTLACCKNRACVSLLQGQVTAWYIKENSAGLGIQWRRQPVLSIYIYMQHSTTSVIARTINEKMPSAVVTFLLSAFLLALCEYCNEFKFAIIYNSELLKYCVSVAFIVTNAY